MSKGEGPRSAFGFGFSPPSKEPNMLPPAFVGFFDMLLSDAASAMSSGNSSGSGNSDMRRFLPAGRPSFAGGAAKEWDVVGRRKSVLATTS